MRSLISECLHLRLPALSWEQWVVCNRQYSCIQFDFEVHLKLSFIFSRAVFLRTSCQRSQNLMAEGSQLLKCHPEVSCMWV